MRGRPRKKPLGPNPKSRRGRPPICDPSIGLLGLFSAPRDKMLLYALSVIERAQAQAR